MRIAAILILCLFAFLPSKAQLQHPEWLGNAVIYEVNVRQFSEEGTFAAVTRELPRLKSIGVDILWLMPIHPIGKLNRKGTMGSYYSVQDYQRIDSSYGNESDFKNLVETAHKLGMKVILDWVANHTAWDNPWIKQHPEWYVQNKKGEIQTQYDWTDVAKLNFDNKEMRKAMTDALKYWIQKFDIDGYRCDVAFLVPVDFWNQVRKDLDAIKPIMMLAEMEWNTDITKDPASYFTQAFDASYGWNFMGVTHDMAKGKKKLSDFRKEMKVNYERFPADMLKLFFITNHDENSWNGTIDEKYGANWQLYSALSFTMPQSFPLIYTGEEANLKRRLSFFEKDAIKPAEWQDTSRYNWYRNLCTLKHQNKALLSGNTNGSFTELTFNFASDTTLTEKVYAFTRTNGNNEVCVLINFSDQTQLLSTSIWFPSGRHRKIYNNEIVVTKDKLQLPAHTVVIYYK